MRFDGLPPVCPGTEEHFETHVYDPEEGPVLIYWPCPAKPRFWSHDSDYPWRVMNLRTKDLVLKDWEKLHVAALQACAWDDLSTENGDQAATNSHVWWDWGKKP